MLLGQAHLVDRVAASGEAALVTLLFAVGIAAQIGLALLYKSAMWHLYICEIDCRDATRWRDRFSQWLSTAYWVECSFDVVSIACFGAGTWRAVVAATTIVARAG